MKNLPMIIAAMLAAAVGASAQSIPRRATIVGGGGNGGGKCTIEVVVDGAADVEIRGDQGMLRNLKGQAPQWRRFECSSPMPSNPAGFRFAGVDGRGLQRLAQEPRGNGPAIVHIEDPDNGSEGYTFDLFWGGFNSGPVPGGMREGDRDRGNDRGNGGGIVGGIIGGMRRFTTEQAVRVCQDAVRNQALQRFGGRSVEFRETRLDDQPGRNDWIIGSIDVIRDRAPEGQFHFSCSVNFDNGQVRSAQIDADRYDRRDGDRRDMDRAPDVQPRSDRATENCRRALRDRMNNDGYDRVEIDFTRRIDSPGRDLRLNGTLRAERGRGQESFNFSCAVDPRDGDVRSAEVHRW